MSFVIIPGHVIGNCNANELAVLTVLCSYANNDSKKCFPSQQAIADKISVSRKTVNLAIKSLCDKKFLEKKLKIDGGVCEYTINFEKVTIVGEENACEKEEHPCENNSYPPNTQGYTNYTNTNYTQLTKKNIKKKKSAIDYEKPIEERTEEFKNKILDYRGNYPDDMLEAFFNHWAQVVSDGTKMLFEEQLEKKAFDIPRRLTTWANNSKKWSTSVRKSRSQQNDERMMQALAIVDELKKRRQK